MFERGEMMNTVSGDTIWAKINNITNKYTYISQNIECDVVGIGAGITGALCSYHLTKEDVLLYFNMK